ncbi:M48 family metalloprotease [Micromonospora aurantiaca (nom. illeg.)]|uniref:M48 family metalloprotease n=1 Tax=Micromonospora aurantiaca (nom. illeg.) TaxID=47850 RepID=UPI00365134C4
MADPPQAELTKFLNRVGRLRSYVAILLSFGSLVLVWRVLFVPFGSAVYPIGDWLPEAILSIVLSLSLVNTVAEFLARRPRWHTRAGTEHAEAVRSWSARFGVTPPQVLVTRSRYLPGIGLRGWGKKVAIVITTATSVSWEISPSKRVVHLAHELAHIWAHDLRLYYRVLSITAISIASLVSLTVATWWNDGNQYDDDIALFMARVALLAALTFLAGRAYLRFREHVADVTAMLMIDDTAMVRGELVGAPDQRLLGRLIGTHPSREARLAMLFNPTLLFKSETSVFLALGCAVGFFHYAITYLLHPIALASRMPGRSVFLVGSIVVAGLLAAALPRTLLEQFVFHRDSMRSTVIRMSVLFLGIPIGMLFLSPMQLIPEGIIHPSRWLLAAVASLTGGVVVAGACLALVLTNEDAKPKTAAMLFSRVAMFLAVILMVWLTGRLFAS